MCYALQGVLVTAVQRVIRECQLVEDMGRRYDPDEV